MDPDLAYLAKLRMPEIRRGTGPNQLAYGQATQLNQGLERASAAIEPSGPQGTPQPSPQPQNGPAGLQMAGTGTSYRPATDEDKFLFGPTQRPNESVFKPIPRIPADVDEWLPWLAEAATRPDASPQIIELFRIVTASVGPA